MSWIVPVGTPGGIVSGFSGRADSAGVVCLGGEFALLDQDRYRIWRAAQAAPEAAELLQWAIEKSLPNAEGAIRTMKDLQLLIEQRPDPRLHAGQLALRLIGECLGNAGRGDDTFAVVGRNGARLTVPVVLFEVLVRADGVSPLLQQCETLDRSLARPDLPPSVYVLFDALPRLVRHHVLRLDGVRA